MRTFWGLWRVHGVSISPKYIVESRSASPIPRPATPANTAALEEDEVDCEEDSAAAPETATNEKRSGKRVTSNTLPVQADKRRKKKLKKRADENNEAEDRWLALLNSESNDAWITEKGGVVFQPLTGGRAKLQRIDHRRYKRAWQFIQKGLISANLVLVV